MPVLNSPFVCVQLIEIMFVCVVDFLEKTLGFWFFCPLSPIRETTIDGGLSCQLGPISGTAAPYGPSTKIGWGLKRVRRSPLVYGPVTTNRRRLHSCRKDRRMSWGNLATSHKSPLEISQLGFRNEFDCPAQISAITQQGENQSTVNNQTKIGRKPILNRKHCIVSACSKSPPHHPPHHVNRFPNILSKHQNSKDLKVLHVFSSSELWTSVHFFSTTRTLQK